MLLSSFHLPISYMRIFLKSKLIYFEINDFKSKSIGALIYEIGPDLVFWRSDLYSSSSFFVGFFTILVFWGDPKTKFLRLFLSTVRRRPIRPPQKNFS